MTKLIAPRRNEVVTPDGSMTPRFAEYLESIADITNETTDTTSAVEATSTQAGVNAEEQAEDEAFFYARPQSPVKEWNAAIKTSTYQSVANDFIEMQSSYVYLPEFPNNSDEVIIASGYDQNVAVLTKNYGVKVKNTESSVTISQKGTSLHFVFFVDGPYWRIV